MGDVFPRRNLGPAEYWGRTVEVRVESVEKVKNNAGLQLTGINRSNTSSQTELSRNLASVQEQLVRSQEQLLATQALAAQLPATGSGAAHVYNYSLDAGWQTVTSASIDVPAGKNNLSVVATGVCRIIDPGANGGGGGGDNGFRWPYDPRPISQGGTVTSEYGPRNGRMHQGIDFGVPQGTPIPAANAGTVSGNGYGSGTGWYVDINHGNGIRTRYFHMVAQSDVPIGAVVEKSQVIGFVGNTGNSFGAHLHWETIVNGSHMNPRDFMAIYGSAGSGGGTGTPTTYARPRARIAINGNLSRVFFPHRNFIGPSNASITLNQIFPQHGVNLTGTNVNIEFQIFAEDNVPQNVNSFARLVAFGVFQP